MFDRMLAAGEARIEHANMVLRSSADSVEAWKVLRKMKAAGREFGGHGSCRARSVVVKVVAAPYESARVVADIPSRTPLRDVRVAFIGDVSDAIRNEVADAGATVVATVDDSAAL